MLPNLTQFFAQATPETDVVIEPNVQPVSEAEVEAGGILAGSGLFILVLGVLHLAFFLIAIVHLIKNSDVKNRALWIVLSIFVPPAAWVYVLGPRRSYNKQAKGDSPVAATSQTGPAQPTGTPAASPSQWQNPTVPAAAGAASTPVAQSAEPEPQFTPEAETPQVAAAPDVTPQPETPAEPSVDPISISPDPQDSLSPTIEPEPASPVDPVATPPTPPAEETPVEPPAPQPQDDNQFPTSSQV